MKWAWGLSLIAHVVAILILSQTAQDQKSPQQPSTVDVSLHSLPTQLQFPRPNSPERDMPATEQDPAQPSQPPSFSVSQAISNFKTSPTSGEEISPAALEQIQARIDRNLSYPAALQRRKIEGSLFVQLELDPAGTLVKLSITQSTGNPILDQLALQSIQNSAPFPEAAQTKTGNLILRLPVHFKLNSKIN